MNPAICHEQNMFYPLKVYLPSAKFREEEELGKKDKMVLLLNFTRILRLSISET